MKSSATHNQVTQQAYQCLPIALVPAAFLVLVPFSAHAVSGFASGSSTNTPLGILLANIGAFINQTLVPFLLGIAFLVLVYGVVKYFVAGGANDAEKEKGKSLMIYAVAGFVLILIFFGVVNLLVSTAGLGGEALDNLPQPVPVP